MRSYPFLYEADETTLILMTDLVMKIGGSLISHIREITGILHASDTAVLIIPGGGVFTDTVRTCGLDGSAAHWMAIAGMEQYGWYISSFQIPVTDTVSHSCETKVLLPYCFLKKTDPLSHSWEITSDTIAAFIASLLGTELVLLKSVDGIQSHGTLMTHITEPVTTDVVDPYFIGYVLSHAVQTTIINGKDPDRVSGVLGGNTVPGTLIP